MDQQIDQQLPVQTPKKQFLVPFLIVLVLIAGVEFFLLMQKTGKLPSAVSTVENQELKATVQEGLAEGVMGLSSGIQGTSVGVPITFVVKLDSNKRGVVAMDAVVSFDKTAFTAGPVRSSLAGFTAVSSTQKNYLEITSSKDPQTVKIPVLANTDVFSFTLTPIKAGTFTVELLSSVDKSSTKFVDSNTEIFLPKVNTVSVAVK